MSKLVCTVESGMSDRIGLIVAGSTLAHQMGREFQFYWQNTWHCRAPFTDILTGYENHIVTMDPHPEVPLIDVCENWGLTHDLMDCEDEVIKLRGFPTPDPWGDWGSKLQFSDRVKDAANGYVNGRDLSQYLGIHLRVGDYAYKAKSVDDYVGVIRKYWHQFSTRFGGVYMATDDPLSLIRMGDKLQVPVLGYPVRTYDREDPRAVFDGAVELCILRKCGRLVLSSYSKFSKLACVTQPPQVWPDAIPVWQNN